MTEELLYCKHDNINKYLKSNNTSELYKMIYTILLRMYNKIELLENKIDKIDYNYKIILLDNKNYNLDCNNKNYNDKIELLENEINKLNNNIRIFENKINNLIYNYDIDIFINKVNLFDYDNKIKTLEIKINNLHNVYKIEQFKCYFLLSSVFLLIIISIFYYILELYI